MKEINTTYLRHLKHGIGADLRNFLAARPFLYLVQGHLLYTLNETTFPSRMRTMYQYVY